MTRTHPALEVHSGTEGNQGLDTFHLRNAVVTFLNQLEKNDTHTHTHTLVTSGSTLSWYSVVPACTHCTFSRSFRALTACMASGVPGVVLFTMFWTVEEHVQVRTLNVKSTVTADTCYTHLNQQLNPGDSLEREDEEGPQRKSLTNRTPFQFLHDLFEPGVLVPDNKRRKTSRTKTRSFGFHF